jgi:hypothetical protein
MQSRRAVFESQVLQNQGHSTALVDSNMKEVTRIMAARANLSRDEDGRRAARLVGLSMGLLFGVILVLQAVSW